MAMPGLVHFKAEIVEKASITDLHEPKLLGDGLVLPQAAFAAVSDISPKIRGVTLSRIFIWKN